MPKYKEIFYLLVILIFCGIYFLFGFKDTYFITPWDDAFYIRLAGMSIWDLPAEHSPIYVLFLKVIVFFSNNAVDTFYHILALQTLTLTFLTYLLAIRFQVSTFGCFVLSYFVLISSFNLPIVYSKVSHFNAIFFLATLVVITFIKSERMKWLGMGIAIATSLYLRIDNIILAILFLGWGLFKLKYSYKAILTYAVLVFGTVSILGSPFAGNKSWDSFCDWYFWVNTQQESILDITLKASSRLDVYNFIESVFGKATSLVNAGVNNPQALLAYFFKNAIVWLANFPFWVTGHFPLSRDLVSTNAILVSFLEFLIFIGIVWFCSKKSPTRFATENSNSIDVLFFATFAFFLKALSTSMILAPAPRYNIEFVILFSIFLLVQIDRYLGRLISTSGKWLIVAVLIVLCPSQSESYYKDLYANRNDQLYSDVVAYIQKIPGIQDIRLLCATPIDTYLGRKQRSYNGRDFIEQFDRKETLGEYINRHQIQVVVIDKKIALLFKENYKYDELLKFVNEAKDYGFSLLVNELYQPEWPFIVLVKNQLVL